MLLVGSTRRTVFLAVLAVSLLTLELHAQKTIVRGTVTDSATGEALPHVNISFLNSNEGTTTDESGHYEIKSSKTPDSLTISFIGYRNRTIAIETGKEQERDIVLSPKWVKFKGIEIRPEDRENPAHPIIRKTIENKSENRPASIPYYEYEVYNRLNIGMGVRPGVEEKWWLQPIRFVFENVDSSGATDYLPIFVSEAVSKIYYRERPQAKKEYVKATRTSGLENPTVTKYMGNMYQEIEIYRNNIRIFGKTFKSPVANGGFAFYNYYLMDSVTVDSSSCFKIRVKPKRKSELTFQGDLYIEDSSFAIKKLDLAISEGANINYVQELKVRQEFDRFEEKYWMLTENEVDVEAGFRVPHNLRWQEFFAHKATYYDAFSFGKERADSVYASTDDIAIQKIGPGDNDSTEKGESYWKEHRPIKLTDNERAVFEMTDSIKKMPYYKVARSLARGYAEAGPIEIGPFFSMYSFNAIEGNRFRLGFRTNELFDGDMNLSAYGAYGTKDENYKYAVRGKYFFQRQPTWEFLGASYQKDLQQLGTGRQLLGTDNILNSTFRRREADRLNSLESFRIFYNKAWNIGLSTRLEAQKRTLSPRGSLEYLKSTENGHKKEVNGISTTELSLYSHFGFKEKYYTTKYRRVSLGSTYPLIDLNYTYGFKDLLGSDHGYQKLVGRISHRIQIGYPGTFEYRLEGGKYWGALPYPLLELHDGNETYFLNQDAFNMMNYYEFVSDEYASLFLTHHFEGLFFNRIPLLRRLKFRSVISGKALIGSFKDANREKMLLPEELYTIQSEGDPFNKPYVEASVGIENILTFIRVDAVWRLTHLDHPNISPFGVRATVQFGF